MTDCEPEFKYSNDEAFIKKRETLRRGGRPFSTDIATREEYDKYEALFLKVYNGASQLETTCLGYKNKLEGQMGMVKFGTSDDEDDIRAVTALYNILKRSDTKPIVTTCTFSGKYHNETFAVSFPDMGTPVGQIERLPMVIGDTATRWDFGVDVATGHFPPPTPLSSIQQGQKERFHVFQAVDSGYKYTVGTKIAMAIFAKEAATTESARIRQTDVDPDFVYGPADEVSIYTGKVTHVLDQFFVHNVNSFRGCAGALMFLLDGPNAGRCIGVHVGSPPDIEPAVNLAVKINEEPVLVKSPSKEV